MIKLVTSVRWIRLLLVLFYTSLYSSACAQSGYTITCSLASNPTVAIPNYGNPLIGCQYHFTATSPGSSSSAAVGWAFPNAGSGVPPGVTIVGGSLSSPTIDVVYSSSANSSQPIRAMLGSSTSITNQYYIGTNNLSAVAITASANPACINTPITLSLTNISGVSSVYWIGYTASSNASNGFALQIPNGITGPTTFQVSISGGCGSSNVTVTRSITITPLRDNLSQVAGERDVITGANQGAVTLTNYNGAIQSWQSSQDNGNTWTTLSQTTEDLPYVNLTTTTLYRAITSQCGVTYTSTSCPIRVHAATDDLSWTETKTFALNGTTLTSDSRTYMDSFAKPLQSQAKSLSTGKILATQPLYGKYDLAVGSTLAAPIAPVDFAYQPTFVTPVSATSAAYDYTRFDDGAKLNAPEAVSSATRNTLGWYYSTNNDLERYTATTAFPYSRTDAMPDGSTGVSRMAGPSPGLQLGGTTADGKTHEVVQGSFPVRTELDTYATIRNNLFPSSAVGGQVSTMKQAAVQQLSTDADGNTALVFLDKEGHSVMSARPATTAVVAGQPDAWMTTTNAVEVGWPYSVQLPANTTLGTAVAAAFTCAADIMVFDNQGSWLVTGSPDAIANNPNVSGNVGNYLFFSTSAFTIAAAPTTGGTSTTYTSQQREAYPFFNFYVVGDGSTTITSKSGLPSSTYTLVNTITGQPASYSSGTALPPGCYQLRIEQGAVNLTYTNRYKDLSYNFFNQKGQLIESIAPKGVQQLLQNVIGGGTITQPAYVTTFEYDQQGRQTAQIETDGGRTEFVYRADGKRRFSQNAKQRANGYFSYLNYDTIGRVLEVGENQGGATLFANCKASSTIVEYIPSYGTYDDGGMGCQTRKDIVRTYYDQATNFSLPSGYSPSFLSGRVAATQKASLYIPCAVFAETSRTLYSYDEKGRTQWLVQQTGGNNQPARTIDYSYDAAGNTATVCYQKNTPAERLTHYYTYDADSRLSLVQTDNLDPATSPSYGRTEQARYTYYLHGPLKRVVYGGNLQGVDYTYTTTGQLKSINDGDIQRDPGQDGNNFFGAQYADFFGTSLQYYQNDYASAAVPSLITSMSTGAVDYVQHYNGLVSGMNWQTPGSQLNAYGYNYDYKGQLVKANYGRMYNYVTNRYSFIADPSRYQESNLDYDANGNIGHLQRTDGMGVATLAGVYDYAPGTNRLNQVLNAGSQTVSYTYDAIGQVTVQQESDPTKTKYLDYDASGKVTAIYADNSHNQPVAKYTYDEFGKRLVQQVFPNPLDQTSYTTTTFVRDVTGHELASYIAVTTANSTAPTFLYEQPIYGMTRLGIYRQARDRTPAEQLYELNDHLGNTRVVFRRPTTTTYVLSMEDSRVSQEKQDFPGPSANTYNDVRTSYTAYGASPYNTGGVAYSMQLLGQQGPTKILAAQKGDKLHLSAYATYSTSTVRTPKDPTPYPSPYPPYETEVVRKGVRLGLVGMQVKPSSPSGPERTQLNLSNWQHALSQVALGVSIPLYSRAGSPKPYSSFKTAATQSTNTPPNAFLQYVVRRASDNSLVRSGMATLSQNAATDWEQLALDVTITEDYPVAVEVSAQSNDLDVAAYFDDLAVQYTPGPVIEENHYYAYGQRLDGLSWRRTDERLYGRGYQGQNTTQDAESGYTAFDARVYDARIGRWSSPDPLKQFDNPYPSMGNNPVSYIDSDGRWVILATMAIGATLNAGSTALDIYLSGSKFDAKAGKRIFASAIGGAIAGSGLGGLPVAVGLGIAGNILDQAIDKDFSTDVSSYKKSDIYLAGLSGLIGGRAAQRLSKLVYSPMVNQSVKTFLEKNLEQSVGAIIGYSTTKLINFGAPPPLQHGYPRGALPAGQIRGTVEVGDLKVNNAGNGITSYDLPQLPAGK